MTETTKPVSATEMLAYLLTQYERAVSIHARVRMDTAEDRRLHADAVTTLHRAAEPVARYLDSAARKRLAVADIPAGQGPASLYLVRDERGFPAVFYRDENGHPRPLRVEPAYYPPGVEALWEHLAATLPNVTTEETP